MSKIDKIKVTTGKDSDGEYINKEYTREEYIEKFVFKRIDPYHSIAHLSEENTEGWLHNWQTDEDLGWKEIGRSKAVGHESFPEWQNGIETIAYIDDNYTYILNQIYCGDGHIAPMHMGIIIRLDKKVTTIGWGQCEQ